MKIGDRVAAKMAELGWSEGELSRRSKVPQPTVHRIITGESKSPKQPNVESIAKALGVSVEYLWYGGDIKDMPPAGATLADYTAAALVDERFVVIPRFDIAASMGPGVAVPEHLEVLQQLVVDREWIRDQRLNYSALPNLVVITGFGDSMLGTFSSGDPLLVDRGITAMDKDGIYVFTRKDHLHIKRLQFIDGDKVLIISDNTTYKPYEVPLAEVSIHARVLIGLNVRKME